MEVCTRFLRQQLTRLWKLSANPAVEALSAMLLILSLFMLGPAPQGGRAALLQDSHEPELAALRNEVRDSDERWTCSSGASPASRSSRSSRSLP